LTDFVRTVCDRLAGLGFVAYAPDLYHGPTASTIPEATRLEAALEASNVRRDLLAAVDGLVREPGVKDHALGLLGFSLGAYHGLWLACERGRDFGGVVVYYGTRNAEYGKAGAAFLGHFAETDPYVSAEELREFEAGLRAAGRGVAIHVYRGTGHWFFEEDREDAYDEKAAKLSWKRTTEFLRKHVA
jgi:carboxymethylenebutenolidase